jgi:RloB-like protein
MARIQQNRKLRENVAIVGDGQMEQIYFLDLRDTDRPKDISIKPEIPRRIGSFHGVLQKAAELVPDYSKVFAFIDMDKIIQDNQIPAYIKLKREVESIGVIVLENNPCFEIWLLMHFTHTGKLYQNCDEVSAELRKNNRIPNYEKSKKFLLKARLYNSYKHLIHEHAIKNSKLLARQGVRQDELFPKADAYLFFEWYFNRGR